MITSIMYGLIIEEMMEDYELKSLGYLLFILSCIGTIPLDIILSPFEIASWILWRIRDWRNKK